MLKNYYKSYLLIFYILFLFFLNISFVLALEAKYPPIGGYTVTNGSGLGDYVAYFFALAITAAGILAVVSVAIGAVKIMISVDNAVLRKDGIDTIKGALLGLVLTIASFIILNTINTAFVTESLTPLPSTSGIFYTNGNDLKPAPMEEATTSNIPEGYSQLVYKCNSAGPALFVWQFPEANFQDDEGYSNTFVQTLNCDDPPVAISGGSFKMAFKTPGIYYFLKEGCEGYMSQTNLASGQLADPFKNKIKSIKIVNDISNDIRYGAVFHSSDDPTRSGLCTMPLLINSLDKSEGCLAGINTSSSVTVFVWNAKNPQASGTGIDFYSEPWGQNIGARAGKYSLSNKNTDGSYWNYWDGEAQSLIFNYNKIDRPSTYKQLYQNFYQHPGSVNVRGNYLLLLNALSGQGIYCQTFFKDISNLKETEFFATGNKPDIIDVIPIK